MNNSKTLQLVNCNESFRKFLVDCFEIANLEIIINDKGFPYCEDQMNFIMIGCDYSCSLERCLQNFSLIFQYRKIPLLLVRPYHLKNKIDYPTHFILTRYDNHQLSILQEEILKTIQKFNRFYYSHRDFFHPTNSIHKIMKTQKIIAEIL